MRFKLGSAWRKGTPIVNVGGQWKPIVERWVKVNSLWTRFFTPAPNFNGIVNMEARSNQYWELYYAFSSDHINVGSNVGTTTTKKTVDGINVAAIALTVRLPNGVDQHRTVEIVLDGEHLDKNIPVVYIDGIPAYYTHSTISGGDTVIFYKAEQDILPKPDMEVSF